MCDRCHESAHDFDAQSRGLADERLGALARDDVRDLTALVRSGERRVSVCVMRASMDCDHSKRPAPEGALTGRLKRNSRSGQGTLGWLPGRAPQISARSHSNAERLSDGAIAANAAQLRPMSSSDHPKGEPQPLRQIATAIVHFRSRFLALCKAVRWSDRQRLAKAAIACSGPSTG